ncbi:Peripheral-type benzodiazepine receptor-associated protein [Dirofilaria immitis]
MVIFADAHHQLGVRVVAINEKEIDRCISKRAYFDREKNRLIILSSHELCKLSIVEDVNEETVKWLLINCNETVTATMVIIIGILCYCTKRKKQKQKQQEKQQSQQQGQQMSLNTSSEELHKMTDHTTSTLALTIQATSSADLNLIQNHTKTEKKARMKQNKLEEISKRINRQADKEFQQEKKELKLFYKQVRQIFPEKTERTQQQSEKC